VAAALAPSAARCSPPAARDAGGGLCAQDNLLTTLPPEIERLTNLTLLSLKGNPLKILPVELARLPKARRPRAVPALHFSGFLFRAIERTYFSVPGPRRR
jgi:hypothetical protein